MVLDGFKSYGTRVEINDFDREFNAITGLNGTGKSNILDGICFVLGIQVKQVRFILHYYYIFIGILCTAESYRIKPSNFLTYRH